MFRYIMLLTYGPILLEVIRQSYDPLLAEWGKICDYTNKRIGELMTCHCKLCEERRKLNLNTFH